ncbi:non-classical arabinogalactan protein 31-like [Aedes aegypti]|uniref:Uncharacterized protein n=1 Tax=Aedes aegypti TaxID=7159 RepID=A0A6I8TZZ5_AEDAE|nr:non-classical arabinogalactan protein 31-like [Aedes aegypti]
MFKIIVCIVLALFSHAECKPYSSPKPYPDPQRQCRTGHCNVNPSLRYDSSFYPSANQLQRVGVYPGCDADDSDEVEESQPPPQMPPSEPSDNSLPVSVCVQLPPKTALKLPKCVLQQIVYALTKDDNALEPQPETTVAPCTQTTTPPPQTTTAPCTQPPPVLPPAPIVYPGYPIMPSLKTTTASPVVYPPPISALKQPYKPSSYCGSCRSSLTPRYNKS